MYVSWNVSRDPGYLSCGIVNSYSKGNLDFSGDKYRTDRKLELDQ